MRKKNVLYEKEWIEEKYVYENKCPICERGNSVLCPEHACKDFKWIREYINNLEKYDDTTVYILSSYITNRVSMIIDKLEIIDGYLDVEGYLEKDSCSEYMERILKEIISLEKAKKRIIAEIRKNKGEI